MASPGGLATRSDDHREPAHLEAPERPLIAVQTRSVGQSTAIPAPDVANHFHRSAALPPPIATQAVADGHETVRSSLPSPAACWGGFCHDHVEPFQRTTNGTSTHTSGAQDPGSQEPTAVQARADEHDTALREAPDQDRGKGIDCASQRRPFQRSRSTTAG